MSRQQKRITEAQKSRPSKLTQRAMKPHLTRSAPAHKSAVPAKPWETVRQDKLHRAKQLLQDAQYPSDEVIESVAKLLARNWRRLRNAPDQVRSS